MIQVKMANMYLISRDHEKYDVQYKLLLDEIALLYHTVCTAKNIKSANQRLLNLLHHGWVSG